MGLPSREEPKHLKLRTGGRLDRVGATAECWVCGRCGYVHWFLGQ